MVDNVNHATTAKQSLAKNSQEKNVNKAVTEDVSYFKQVVDKVEKKYSNRSVLEVGASKGKVDEIDVKKREEGNIFFSSGLFKKSGLDNGRNNELNKVTYENLPQENRLKQATPKEDLTKTKKYELDTAEGLEGWKQDKLAFTGEAELSDADIEGLAKSIVDNAKNKGMWDEDYSHTKLERVALSSGVYDSFSEDQELKGYDAEKFLTRMPDELYQVLKPATGKVLVVDDIQGLLDEYAVLQPFHKNEQVQERLDGISKELKQYQEAANYRESYYDNMSESSEWVDNKKLNYRYESSHADFKKEFQDARYDLNGKNYRVSELLSNISENDRKNHVAAYDSKYGAFDPKDKKGLFDRIGDFFEGIKDVVVDVLESPIVQGVLTVAQFIPITGPAATALKAVSVANAVNNTAKAIDKGDIGGVLTGAASAFSGAASLSGASNLAKTADNLHKAGSVARAIDDPSATNLLSAATSFAGGSTELGQNLNTALKVSQARDAALSDGETRALGLLLQAGEIAFADSAPTMSTQLGDAGDVLNGVSNLADGDVAAAVGDFSGFIDYSPIGEAVSRFGEDVVDAFSHPKPQPGSFDEAAIKQLGAHAAPQQVINFENGEQARVVLGPDGQLVYIFDTTQQYQREFPSLVEPYPFSGADIDDQWMSIKLGRGDTLGQIAQEYGVSINDILKVNPGLSDPDKIRADDILNLPLAAEAPDRAINLSQVPLPAPATVPLPTPSLVPQPAPLPGPNNELQVLANSPTGSVLYFNDEAKWKATVNSANKGWLIFAPNSAEDGASIKQYLSKVKGGDGKDYYELKVDSFEGFDIKKVLKGDVLSGKVKAEGKAGAGWYSTSTDVYRFEDPQDAIDAKNAIRHYAANANLDAIFRPGNDLDLPDRNGNYIDSNLNDLMKPDTAQLIRGAHYMSIDNEGNRVVFDAKAGVFPLDEKDRKKRSQTMLINGLASVDYNKEYRHHDGNGFISPIDDQPWWYVEQQAWQDRNTAVRPFSDTRIAFNPVKKVEGVDWIQNDYYTVNNFGEKDQLDRSEVVYTSKQGNEEYKVSIQVDPTKVNYNQVPVNSSQQADFINQQFSIFRGYANGGYDHQTIDDHDPESIAFYTPPPVQNTPAEVKSGFDVIFDGDGGFDPSSTQAIFNALGTLFGAAAVSVNVTEKTYETLREAAVDSKPIKDKIPNVPGFEVEVFRSSGDVYKRLEHEFIYPLR